MATFYKFGKLWEIPPAAARLGTSLPANTQAFETFLTNLEPMFSNFIAAHPRCPKDPDLPAVRYAIKEFMEEQAPSNFFKERWAASYDPARKVTYVSWFLGTVAYFLDKLDFTTLVAPPVETKFPVFISEPPSAPLDPSPPQSHQAPLHFSVKRGVSESRPTHRSGRTAAKQGLTFHGKTQRAGTIPRSPKWQKFKNHWMKAKELHPERSLKEMTYSKVTRRLIPLLFVCYFVAYLDRVNVSFAKLEMLDDLKLSDTVYGLYQVLMIMTGRPSLWSRWT